ncbi:lactate/malate family dehydrogenase [Helicovermis profundi]|uniref:Lactate/malate dehydrogenase N-terminal domain-containing protein n=1 Tax=Helicovermis profundi TaxID=3065157 RepID=A0AAU9E6L4_9FIRM|nr:hypothetical protein HLPR_20910 [Clostridia bacterium S502]
MKYYKLMNSVLVDVEEKNEYFKKFNEINEDQAKLGEKFIICINKKNKNTKSYYKLLSSKLIKTNNDGLEYLFDNELLENSEELPKWLNEKIELGIVSIYNLAYGAEHLEKAENYYNNTLSKKKKVNVLGLGDVGGILLVGLRLLGSDSIEEIGIFDLDKNKLNRWEAELNQIIDFNNLAMPKIKVLEEKDLFNCHMFVFSASKSVPEVGSDIKDVREFQREANSKIISIYAKMARKRNFSGIFAVVSDPVDELCKVVYRESNKDENNVFDYKGLLAEKIRGYGLGVMHGRSLYYADKMGVNSTNIRVYGPHGKNLIVANDILNYDEELSYKLTNKTIKANMDIREYGYKPFIAPAISSGALSIINTLSGNWHYSAIFAGGCYFGIKNRETQYGLEIERLKVDDKLYNRIKHSYMELSNE